MCGIYFTSILSFPELRVTGFSWCLPAVIGPRERESDTLKSPVHRKATKRDR